MNAKLALLLVGLLVALVGAAGCGGDDEEGGETEAAAPTREEYIAQADTICREGDAEIEAAAEEVFDDGQPAPEEAEAFITDTVIPSTQSQIDGVRALTPPEGDEETIAGLLDSAQAALDELEQDPSLVLEGGGADPFAEIAPEFADYGFQVCAAGEDG